MLENIALPEDLTDWLSDLDLVDASLANSRDIWHWLSTAVLTVDELDAATPVKPFPTGACRACSRYVGSASLSCPACGAPVEDMAYLRDLARQWQSAEPPLLLVPKARRMRLTWLFVACHVWLALQRSHANIFFVSSKEEKSAELVERARGIVARLPSAGGGGRLVEHRVSPPTVRWLESGSQIMGVAEGADQLRQYTATAILADEFGTWAWPRAAFSSMRPCIDGGGRLTLLSSAWPGTWAEMIRGEFLG
jgi:hypothetical protein